ncbi:MAG: hypothetical protein RIE86_19035 [Imperialibacter sp.]|uniref:hypothetical protein n=1 Tax=Imperialibacter sp. TaxID=2038411 RepID=UPI0032EAC8D7
MRLNRYFLGSDSQVDIETVRSLVEIRDLLASKFDRIRLKPFYKESDEYQSLVSDLAYQLTNGKLTIYFSKELRRRFGHSFQLNYPRFIGTLADNNGKIRIKGQIGFGDWFFVFPIIWLAVFIFIYVSWWYDPSYMPGGHTAIYFILFGLFSFLTGLIRTRNKVFEMRTKIDAMVEGKES